MAIFTATVSAPNCTYARTAETPDEAWAGVIEYWRAVRGQIPIEEGSPELRDLTEEEIANFILGGMLQREFEAAAAWRKAEAAKGIEPATWTVTA